MSMRFVLFITMRFLRDFSVYVFTVTCYFIAFELVKRENVTLSVVLAGLVIVELTTFLFNYRFTVEDYQDWLDAKAVRQC